MLKGNIRDGVIKDDIIDLHVHSDKSDGTYTPEELVRYAAEKDIRVMALTDHDTVEGLPEIRRAAEKTENAPVIVSGVELSTDLDGHDIHILGLFIDEDDPGLMEHLQKFKDARDVRNEKMCAALREGLKMDISTGKLKKAFPGAVITRAHYAGYMLSHGYVRSVDEAFDRWIGDGKPYFIPREKVSPCDGIELVRRARGIPVLAHPILCIFSCSKLESLISDLVKAGLKGIESRYSTYSSAETRQMKLVAEKYGLLESGGSDFHGSNKKDIDLGTGRGNLKVPYELYEKLKAYKEFL